MPTLYQVFSFCTSTIKFLPTCTHDQFYSHVRLFLRTPFTKIFSHAHHFRSFLCAICAIFFSCAPFNKFFSHEYPLPNSFPKHTLYHYITLTCRRSCTDGRIPAVFSCKRKRFPFLLAMCHSVLKVSFMLIIHPLVLHTFPTPKPWVFFKHLLFLSGITKRKWWFKAMIRLLM